MTKTITTKPAVSLAIGDMLYIDGSFLSVTSVNVKAFVQAIAYDATGSRHTFSFPINNNVKVSV